MNPSMNPHWWTRDQRNEACLAVPCDLCGATPDTPCDGGFSGFHRPRIAAAAKNFYTPRTTATVRDLTIEFAAALAQLEDLIDQAHAGGDINRDELRSQIKHVRRLQARAQEWTAGAQP